MGRAFARPLILPWTWIPTNQSSCICVSLLNSRHDCFHTMHPRNTMLDTQMDLELMLTLRASPGFALSYVGTQNESQMTSKTLQSMPLVVPSGVQSTASWHPGATRKVLEPGRCHRGQARQGEEPQNCPRRGPLPAELTLWVTK